MWTLTLRPPTISLVTALVFQANPWCKQFRVFSLIGPEWYSLGTLNGGKYSFVVIYSGHVYNFTAQLGHATYTCATLQLPSGVANVTTGPTTCYADSSSSTTSNDSWQFSMKVNYYGSGNFLQPSQVEGIEVDVNLTFVGAQSENVDIVAPLLAGGLQLFQVNTNGSLTDLWGYTPPGVQEYKTWPAKKLLRLRYNSLLQLSKW